MVRGCPKSEGSAEVVRARVAIKPVELIVKFCVTDAAAANVGLPGWLAVIEQVPTLTGGTLAPETVQTATEFETKVTVSPELAVAVKAMGAGPVWLPGDANVID